MLQELKPPRQQRVMDLVAAAGVNVSDWQNFKGGAEKAASNPKYCYEWSFIEPQKLVVLNLWYSSMQEKNGAITQDINFRQAARRQKPVWQKRATKLDRAIQTAYRDKLPIRVIICDGKRRKEGSDEATKVKARMLDPMPWAVAAYDWDTGDCRVMRGVPTPAFVDQFIILEKPERPDVMERREVTSQTFIRSAEVRRRVLMRANGKCEWCAQPGFVMANGSIYLETHHIVPLSENGPDNEANVAALCPNHHREAHHGANGLVMRAALLDRLLVRKQ